MASFDAEIRPTARVSFRPRGEQQHDDLLMALALACWYSGKLTPPGPIPGGHPFTVLLSRLRPAVLKALLV
ncbi:MAG: hypothetical protein ACKV22_27075 [Bryobacteraceae bacterium]